MAGESNRLGEAYVEVTARVTQLDQKLAEAEAKTEQSTKRMGATAEKNIGDGFKRASSQVTSLIGSVTALVGTFYIFERLGEKIGTVAMAFVRAKDNALEFRRALRDLSTDQLGAEFDKVAQSTESGIGRIVDWGKQLTDLVGLTEDASQAGKLAAIEAEAQQKRQLEQIKRRIELEKELAKTIAERNARERAEYEELVKRRIEARDAALAYYRELEAADLEAYQNREKRRRDAAAADVRRRLEEINAEREKARSIAEAMTAELAKAGGSQSFAQSIAGPIEEMTRRLEVRLEQLKFRGGI